MCGADDTDEALAARARAGDEAAYAALFRRHSTALRRLVDRRLPPAVQRKVAVEDIVQEARVTAYQRLPEFENRGDGSFLRWMKKITVHKARAAIQHHAGVAKRSVVKEISRGARPDTAAFAGRGPSPSQNAMWSEIREAARRAMATLSADHREVLRLVLEEGLSLGEVAVHMGRSREATKKLYGRALGRFTEAYERLEGKRDA